MNHPGSNLLPTDAPSGIPPASRIRERAAARTPLLVLVCFLLGLGAGAFSYYRLTQRPRTETETKLTPTLSASTVAAIKSLQSPVELRFYSLLDPAGISITMQEFAGRVDELLGQYQQEAGGKITLTRITSSSDANAQAASADGLKPFNLDKGNACYLGLAIAQGSQKESLPQLAPEWEAAVEPDVTRAILRVTRTRGSASVAAVPPDATALAEVKSTVPNFASVSAEEGVRLLREAALKDFAAAADEMELRLKEARQRVADAEQGKSESKIQEAQANLQKVQLEQAEKLKQVAARLQARIAALHELKKQ